MASRIGTFPVLSHKTRCRCREILQTGSLQRLVVTAAMSKRSAFLGGVADRRCHKLGSDRISDRRFDNAIDLSHRVSVDPPPHDVRQWLKLIGVSCAPQRNANALAVEQPAQRQVNDALVVVRPGKPIYLSTATVYSRNRGAWNFGSLRRRSSPEKACAGLYSARE